MNLEQQVCSPELAKRLKELNVKQDSLFYWLELLTAPVIILEKGYTLGIECQYSAFTVAELGAILPDGSYTYNRRNNDWICSCPKNIDGDDWFHSFDNTEANARAKMLIYLIENGLIEQKQCYIPENAASLILSKEFNCDVCEDHGDFYVEVPGLGIEPMLTKCLDCEVTK